MIYKITNITNLVGKRDPKHNSLVNIEYVDGRTKKTMSLKAGEEVFISVQSLPLSVHRLRIKKLVQIAEASDAELRRFERSKTIAKKPAAKKTTAKKPAAKKPAAKKAEVVEATKEEPVAEKKTTRAPRKKASEE